MARKRTATDFDFESFDDDRVLLDLDDLDQDEQECLAALAVHDERLGRSEHEDY
jgi:hypothetical protein